MREQKKTPSCADRVREACESRLEDIRLMLDPTRDDYKLGDDGSLDTVIVVGEEEFRFDSSNFDNDTPKTEQAYAMFADDIEETLRRSFDNYALSFDYVPRGLFNDQKLGFARYQISFGGPQEEIRFFCDEQRTPYRVEFWFLDWGDGACIDITGRSETDLLIDRLGFYDWLYGDQEFWSE
tara:strand:- start:503 stop:1045 length:543 start_codon:yes stop_codon:yes gene_type:complete